MTALQLRRGLVLLSAACYVAWLSPIGASSQADEAAASFGAISALPVPARVPAVVVRRDPFAGEPDTASDRAAAGTAEAANPDARRVAPSPAEDPDDAIVTQPASATGFDFANDSSGVPNIGDAGGLDGANDGFDQITVKATIVGRRAVAYVQNGSVLDIVRVGDRLGARTIVRIELRGIVFDDGSRLDLSENRRATPAPAPPESRPVTMRDLQRALAPLRVRSRSETGPPSPLPSPGDAAPAAEPTPGPLPTIDTRGREPDQTPSSDPSALTPYPVPGIDR